MTGYCSKCGDQGSHECVAPQQPDDSALFNTICIGLMAGINDNAPAIEMAEWVMKQFRPYLNKRESVNITPATTEYIWAWLYKPFQHRRNKLATEFVKRLQEGFLIVPLHQIEAESSDSAKSGGE